MSKLDYLVGDLPSPAAARRFFEQFAERNPSHINRLQKNEGLLSDVLTLASYSPLLAATLIQNPDYVGWLSRKRSDSTVRGKEELLESLARFSLTNSRLEPHVLFARFRRRELLRIFLRDIRRLGTIAEITEEISNLADAILENALRLARQEMDNRYGAPQETDENGRQRPADICVVSLGKLGSKELNYSSDIDLLFIYSAEGSTNGTGTRGTVANREYFVKLAETVTQLVGRQSGEGAAYRVDMRLRPHGRVGALALSLKETTRYYLKEARNWEQQVLIRSRSSAGDAAIFKTFFSTVEESVFKPGRDAAEALNEVYRSKQKIDQEQRGETLFDVKLGRGGIREVEFIAQALQLAHGGTDRWLRAPHTLISIARLTDRGLLTEGERSSLSHAYDFLRRLEHILQMEHGLQTQTVPSYAEKRQSIAAKMRFECLAEFEIAIAENTGSVHATFQRVFNDKTGASASFRYRQSATVAESAIGREEPVFSAPVTAQNAVSATQLKIESAREDDESAAVTGKISAVSQKFSQFLTARPWFAENIKKPGREPAPDYDVELSRTVEGDVDLAGILHNMRAVWSRLLLDIAVADIYETISPAAARGLQTKLAEAAVRHAMRTSVQIVSRKHDIDLMLPEVLALGKLGSGTLDYDSDLDVIVVYKQPNGGTGKSAAEMYSRVVELFTTLLSDMTRDGNLYRVDLRLRPHGKNGPNVTTPEALTDYIENNASVWELLAYVQMRPLKLEPDIFDTTETEIREAINRRTDGTSEAEIKRETRSMRLRLEAEHGGRRGREVNIKFGSGGLLDVYFVTRYLQLIHGEAVPAEARSTSAKLAAFSDAGLLSKDDHAAFLSGHAFLSGLDHNIRLVVGRSSRLPSANREALARIVARMKLVSIDDLNQQLALHRINIRTAFENVLEP